MAWDRRPRVALAGGRTACASVDGPSVLMRLDGGGGAAGDEGTDALGEFRAAGDVTAWAVSPADPRVMAVGDGSGRVALLRFEDPEHCRAQAAAAAD